MLKLAIEHVLAAEGGYVNHPDDRGGPTNFGITISTLSQWRKRSVTASDVKNLTKEEACAIYKLNYWDAMNLDLVTSHPIAICLFDQGVNRGPASATIQAQKVLNSEFGANLKVDGKLGPMTAAAINKALWRTFIREYLQRSEMAYIELALMRSSQMKFLKGWINRIHRLQDLVITGESTWT